MQPLTNEIYAALRENERRQTELVLIDGHHRTQVTPPPLRRISVLNDF